MDTKVTYLNSDLSCACCDARALCLSGQCSVTGRGSMADEVRVKGPYHSGEHIFHQGQLAYSVYFVRSGTVKCERVAADGGMHVAGFYLPGEMFGGEDIGSDQHCYDALALEETLVCEIPVDRLEGLFNESPKLQHGFLTRIGERLRCSEKSLTDSFHLRAKHRLMDFLCSFFKRRTRRGRRDEYSNAIHLPMNKADIANHLGISPETLSRLLRELEGDGKLRNGLRHIELIAPERGTRCGNG